MIVVWNIIIAFNLFTAGYIYFILMLADYYNNLAKKYRKKRKKEIPFEKKPKLYQFYGLFSLAVLIILGGWIGMSAFIITRKINKEALL